MAAFTKSKVTFSFDFSKEIEGISFSQESLEKMQDTFTPIPILVRVGDKRLVLGTVETVEVNGSVANFTGTLDQSGTLEIVEMLNNKECSMRELEAISMVAGQFFDSQTFI